MLISSRGALLALLLASPLLGAAQALPTTWPKKRQLVEEGVVLHDKQDYAGAIAKYQAVTRGDTSYALAQSEMALSLHAAGRHEEAVAAAKRALAINPFEPQTYNTLANAQEELKQIDAALATYQQALKLFPYNQNLVFNQAVTQLGQNDAAAALVTLQRSLELRPAHPGTHRLLGLLAARQGQTSHALISWLTYLIINDEHDSSNAVLVQAENLSSGAPVVEAKDRVKPVAPNAAFAELDQLLESKVALQKNYASKVKFDAAVVKQAQLLVEKFPVDGPADDFWIRAYGPMVAALRNDDNLTAFTYMFLRTAGDTRAAQWVKSNKTKVEKALKAAFPPLMALREQQQVPGGTPGQRLRGWFGDEGALEGLGEGSNASGTFVATGDWVSVSNTGAVQTIGRFTPAGKQTGFWKVLRPDGSIDKTFTFNDQGEREGPAQEFYPNGQASLVLNYSKGKIDGPFTMYDECGNRTELRSFKAGDLNGPYTTYYANGQVRYRANIEADKVEGLEEEFYIDGAPEFSFNYAKGQKQGAFTSWYPNKAVEKKGSYDNNTLHGTFTEYHANGTVLETGSYEHGKRTGAWKTYFPDGKLSVEKTYDATGELHGIYRDYDEQGRHYADTEYNHGRTTRLQYFDPAGKMVLDQPIKKGRTVVKALRPDGQVSATGSFLDGIMVGEWKWFNRDGGLREQVRYDDKGNKTGTAEVYYPGGQVRRRLRYGANGQEEGLFERFRANGQVQETGYFQDGQRHGAWKSYYVNGRISEEYEYHQGEQNGPYRSYAPSGKPTQEFGFEYGKLRNITTYDSTGKEMVQIVLKPTSKEYTLRYPSGKPLYTASLNCYSSFGPTAWLRTDGSTEVSSAQLDGRQYGVYKSTYADGKPNRVGQYLAGQASGEWTSYHTNGQVRLKGRYLNDEQDGEWTSYFPNGQVAQVQTYLDGALHGPSREYNAAGELLVEKMYSYGDLLSYRGPGAATAPMLTLNKQAGPIKVSFANGKPALDETYAHNERSGPVTAYYSTGEVYSRSQYRDGLLTGLYERFYPGGKPLEQENYLLGERHGRCRYYRPDGTLEREESFRCGELSGPATYFDAAGKPLRTETYWNTMVYDKK